MKQNFLKLYKNPWTGRMMLASVCLLFLYAVLLVWKWRQLPPQIPLFYSLSRGEEQLGTPFHFLLLPLLSLSFFLLDVILAIIFYTPHRLLAILFITMGTITTVLLFATFIRIILLIT